MERISHIAAVWQAANKRANQNRVYDGSHRGTDGNLVGALGECIFEHWMDANQVRYRFVGATSYDYCVGTDELTLEVKTKDRTVAPLPNYEATIPAYNAEHQRSDWYVFVSLLREGPSDLGVDRFSEGFIVGAYPRPAFLREAKLWHKGEVDPSNGTRFWTDCFNLPISKLIALPVAARAWR